MRLAEHASPQRDGDGQAAGGERLNERQRRDRHGRDLNCIPDRPQGLARKPRATPETRPDELPWAVGLWEPFTKAAVLEKEADVDRRRRKQRKDEADQQSELRDASHLRR